MVENIARVEDRPGYRLLETGGDNREAVIELARSARRTIAIFTRDLDPIIFNDREFLDACKDMVLGTRFAHLRILLVDHGRVVKEGSRMMEMCRRLSSFMEIRRPHEDYQDLTEAFVVIDERGILYRKASDRWEGFSDLNDPGQAREKLRLFERIWEKSQVDTDTRQLGI